VGTIIGLKSLTTVFGFLHHTRGTRQNVVSSYIPVVGSIDPFERAEKLASGDDGSLIRLVSNSSEVDFPRDAQVGYQPVVEKPNLGALLEIRATLTGETAVVDLKSTITALNQQLTVPAGAFPTASIAPVVDRIAIETQQFATTLRMPLGKPILVGGLTYAVPTEGRNNLNSEKDVAGEKPQLYLVLEVR
jgi:hypothetical protein